MSLSYRYEFTVDSDINMSDHKIFNLPNLNSVTEPVTKGYADTHDSGGSGCGPRGDKEDAGRQGPRGNKGPKDDKGDTGQQRPKGVHENPHGRKKVSNAQNLCVSPDSIMANSNKFER